MGRALRRASTTGRTSRCTSGPSASCRSARRTGASPSPTGSRTCSGSKARTASGGRAIRSRRASRRARARAHLAGREGRAEEPARSTRGNVGKRGVAVAAPAPSLPPQERTADASAPRLRREAARREAESEAARRLVRRAREFVPFVDEVRGGPRATGELDPCCASAASRRSLAEYAGSMFELRAVVEPT